MYISLFRFTASSIVNTSSSTLQQQQQPSFLDLTLLLRLPPFDFAPTFYCLLLCNITLYT